MKETSSLPISPSQLQVSDKRVEIVVQAVCEKKATKVVVLDLKEVATFTDYFIICSGRASRQVQAIADEVQAQLLKENARTSHIEGYQAGEWVLMDYGDFVVHIFNEEAREFYNLERLWRDATCIEIQE